MSVNWSDVLRDMGRTTGALGSASPETMKMFGGLASAATKDGAIDKKTKELMAVAISICIRCEGCIAYHTNSAIKAGASKDEMVETINVAIEMGGGPSTVYGAKALDAFEQLSKG